MFGFSCWSQDIRTASATEDQHLLRDSFLYW